MGVTREEALTHFGVPGMKWGIRKDSASGGDTRADRKWAKKAGKFSTFTKAYNSAAERMNETEISRINNKPQYKKADFTHDSPLRRKYYKEFNDTFQKVVNEEAHKLMGTNPSGTRRLRYDASDEGQITFRFEDITHDDDDATFIAVTDENGHIVGIKVSESGMEQSDYDLDAIVQALDDDEALEHYGVLGMKWGVVRDKVGGHIDARSKERARLKAPNAGYTPAMRINDRNKLSAGAVRRINRSMNRGKNHLEAVKIEQQHRRTQALVIAGSLMTVRLLALYGPLVMSEISRKASTNRDKRAEAREEFIRNGPPKPATKTAKKSFRGVYNVTTM